MTILLANNAYSSLAGPISGTATSCQIAAGTGALMPVISDPDDYFLLTFTDAATRSIFEIVKVTAMSGDIVTTMVRGQEGTDAIAWQAGDFAANLITAGTFGAFFQTVTTDPTSVINIINNNQSVITDIINNNADLINQLIENNPTTVYNLIAKTNIFRRSTVFLSHGTFNFVVPSDTYWIHADVWGSGGGGGAGNTGAGGGGGSSAGYSYGWVAVSPGSTIVVKVGQRGSGGALPAQSGQAGDSSYFASILAYGGLGGIGADTGHSGSYANGANAGVGGQVNLPGLPSASAFTLGGEYVAGAGAAPYSGGQSTWTTPGIAVTGYSPGGGGSGGANGNHGGDGGDGAVYLIY